MTEDIKTPSFMSGGLSHEELICIIKMLLEQQKENERIIAELESELASYEVSVDIGVDMSRPDDWSETREFEFLRPEGTA